MVQGNCRLARNYGQHRESWDSWGLIVDKISGSHDNKVMRTNPLTAKLLSTILFNGNILPGLIVDFGQWDETYNVTCSYKAPDAQDDPLGGAMDYVAALRRWIITSQSDSLSRMYLQFYTTAEDDLHGTDGPNVYLDAGNIPLGMTPHWGYRGIVTSLGDSYDAGKGVCIYTLTFAVGFVLL